MQEKNITSPEVESTREMPFYPPVLETGTETLLESFRNLTDEMEGRKDERLPEDVRIHLHGLINEISVMEHMMQSLSRWAKNELEQDEKKSADQ